MMLMMMMMMTMTLTIMGLDGSSELRHLLCYKETMQVFFDGLVSF